MLARRNLLNVSLAAGGGMLLTATIPTLAKAATLGKPGPDAVTLNAYLRIAPDGKITITAKKCVPPQDGIAGLHLHGLSFRLPAGPAKVGSVQQCPLAANRISSDRRAAHSPGFGNVMTSVRANSRRIRRGELGAWRLVAYTMSHTS